MTGAQKNRAVTIMVVVCPMEKYSDATKVLAQSGPPGTSMLNALRGIEPMDVPRGTYGSMRGLEIGEFPFSK